MFTDVHCIYYYTICASEFLICFEAWATLAQKWLVCAPLRIHLQPINKEVMLLVTQLTAPSGPKRELCSAK